MSEYIFLYCGGSWPTSPQDAQVVMQKWMTWMQDLATRGHLTDRGQPLEHVGSPATPRSGASCSSENSPAPRDRVAPRYLRR